MAIVAGPTNAVLVSLADPTAPAVVGTAPGIAGRIAVGADGVIFSTSEAPMGGDTPQGGLHASRVGQCDLLKLLQPAVEIDLTRNPANGQMCGRPGEIVFRLCRPANVTMRAGLQPLSAVVYKISPIDPPPAAPPPPVWSGNLDNVTLEPGVYTAVLALNTLPTGEMDARPFRATAVDAESQEQDTADGTIRNRVVNRSVLPVGRTFVKGVDLFDGHVVRQAQDVKLRGRHLGLEVTRSYSSAGRSAEGGWSWNFEARIVEGSCGLWTVITADGSSQTFSSTDQGQTFIRQPGYHTKLERRSGDLLVFTDKSGTEHAFSERQDSGRWRLEYIKEPHGDRLIPRYDARGRVIEVWETSDQDPPEPVRRLKIGYNQVAGRDRVASVTADGPLQVKVVYAYDQDGNLESVRREDMGSLDSIIEKYEYTGEPARPAPARGGHRRQRSAHGVRLLPADGHVPGRRRPGAGREQRRVRQGGPRVPGRDDHRHDGIRLRRQRSEPGPLEDDGHGRARQPDAVRAQRQRQPAEDRGAAGPHHADDMARRRHPQDAGDRRRGPRYGL